MKAPLAFSVLLLLGSGLLSSCEKCGEVSYTPVTEEDAEWLVYTERDTIRFVNEAGQPVNYIRAGVQAVNVPGQGYALDDKCIEQQDTQITNIIQSVQPQQPALATLILKRPDDLSVVLLIQGQGEWEIAEASPTYPAFTLGSHTYSDVFEISPDSTRAAGVKRILFNKEHGFINVAFYNGKSLQLQR